MRIASAAIAILCSLILSHAFAQKRMTVDGDRVFLRDTLDGKHVMLSWVQRGAINTEAVWMTFNRRSTDPWVIESKDRENSYSEIVFMNYAKQHGIKILAAITTYDDCKCIPCRALDCDQVYKINFKILPPDLAMLIELYPEFDGRLKKVKEK